MRVSKERKTISIQMDDKAPLVGMIARKLDVIAPMYVGGLPNVYKIRAGLVRQVLFLILCKWSLGNVLRKWKFEFCASQTKFEYCPRQMKFGYSPRQTKFGYCPLQRKFEYYPPQTKFGYCPLQTEADFTTFESLAEDTVATQLVIY